MEVQLHTIPEAIEDLRQGKMVIVVDDVQRENEGDLVMAGSFATPEAINFMIKEGRGLVCTPMRAEDLARLQIPPMVMHNTDNHQTAFTVSVDHVDTTTGISPYDRSLTIQKLLDATSKPEDFRRPGHIFPLQAREGGVLVRRGHTEASLDLCRLAGLPEVGVICEITKEDGTMARIPDLIPFAKEHDLKMISIADLVNYRKQKENLVEIVSTALLPTEYGDFRIVAFRNALDDKEHLAIVKGDVDGQDEVLIRVHSECLTGDVFGSHRCDCGEQLHYALRAMEEAGCGVLLYMRREGRGIGLFNKIKAYALQEQGLDTVEANEALGFPADMREYALCAQMLRALGVRSVRLLTNNPKKRADLTRWGVDVRQRVPIIMKPHVANQRYLATKRMKMGHMLPEEDAQ